jgi:hypothetical protein
MVLCGGLALAVGLSPSAHGQIGLPDSVTNPPSGSLSASDKEAIQRYVDANKTGLSGGEPAAIEKSRKALLSPLASGPNATVAPVFRIEYAARLGPMLEKMAADAKSDHVAINAVVIAGELGTREGLRILATALKDSRGSVRAAAAMGYRSSMVTARRGQPAFVARDALTAVKDLETALVAEKDPLVADAITIALTEAIAADPTKLPGVRPAAVAAMAGAAGARASASDALNHTAVLARASEALQGAVVEIAPGLALDRDSLRLAAGFAGDLIAIGVRTDPAGVSADKKAELTQILKQAENLYFFSHQKLGGQPRKVDLDQSWAADWSRYKKDALQLLSITMRRDPFNFPENRFTIK